jgi:NTE family protein
VVGVSRASIGLMLATLADLSLRLTPADAVIEPRIGHVDVADFTRADELIREGAAAVERVWPVIGAALQPAEAVTIS